MARGWGFTNLFGKSFLEEGKRIRREETARGEQAFDPLPQGKMTEQIWTSRGSKEFPRVFVPKDANLGDWKQLEVLFQDLLDRGLASKADLEGWLSEVGELESCIDEEASRRYIRMTCNTGDEEAEKAYLHFLTEIEPRLKPFGDALNRKYYDSPHRKGLDREKFSVFDRKTANQIQLFRRENVPLETEDDQLKQKYQKVCGAMMVEFRGEEKTLPQMRKYLEENDRALREEAWETVTERYLKDRETLETIYEDQVPLRDEIAKNAGFPNYRDYMHQAKNRFDYTPADCYAFHEAVEKEIVPLNRRLAETRREQMNLDKLRPWDVQVDPLGREPLRPFETGEELAEKCHRIFEKVDPELGEQFKILRREGLLDLESRKGKAPGGYQCGLEEVRYPFIFMNAAGTDRDVYTLLHEGGHAFHSLASRNLDLASYRASIPMEFCEVASMAMELLGLPYLEEFYTPEEAARSREGHLEGVAKSLAWIATIDAFQHWVYQNPDHHRKERREEWLSLSERFGVGLDWTGHEEALAHNWHRQLHLFTVPFYYIEYGIAQLGALQLWLKSTENSAQAVQGYKKALALGGSRPLPELFETAGIKFSFDRETVAPLAEKLAPELGM
jgi:oligoendopeptidase F